MVGGSASHPHFWPWRQNDSGWRVGPGLSLESPRPPNPQVERWSAMTGTPRTLHFSGGRRPARRESGFSPTIVHHISSAVRSSSLHTACPTLSIASPHHHFAIAPPTNTLTTK